MWDTSLNVDDLLEDYYDKFFGPAREPMKKFWTRGEELWCNMDVKKRGPADNLTGTLYTPAVIAELGGYLQDALELAKTSADAVYAKRVEAIHAVFARYAKRVSDMKMDIPVTTVKRAETAPVLDGVLDDVWQDCDKLTLGDLNTGTESATAPTCARLLHDDKNVYIFVECMEPKMNNIEALCHANDDTKTAIWHDDAVEIFISPDDRVASRCAHIIVNSLGYWYDEALGTRQYPGDKAVQYDSGLTVNAKQSTDRWTVELAIPKENLALDGTPAIDGWRMNICRERNVPGVDTKEVEMTSWSPVLSLGWYTPSRFGYVKF